MNKQAYYLPHLNSLHAQNKDYLFHQQRLKESKSEYQIYSSSDPVPKDGFVAVKQQLFVKMVPQKYSSSRGVHESAEGDLLRVNKSYRMEFTPVQRRNLSEHTRQNQRIYQAIHILSPRVGRYDRSRDQSQIKERISKLMKDGSKISYKFKKSLIEVEKRKKQKDDYYSQRSNIVREDARVQLQSLIQKSIRLSKSKSKQHNDGGITVEGTNDLGRRNSIQKLNIQEILSKAKTTKKNDDQRVKTESQQAPKKINFLKNHRQLINKKILAFHLQNIKFKEKVDEPNRRQELLKRLSYNHVPNHYVDNKLGENSKAKRVLDIQIVQVNPVGYGY